MTYFDRHVFQHFNLSYLKNFKRSFLVALFKSLDLFLLFLFVLITFEPILDDFLRIWTNPEIQDSGPRWPPFRNDYAIFTSYEVITS